MQTMTVILYVAIVGGGMDGEKPLAAILLKDDTIHFVGMN